MGYEYDLVDSFGDTIYAEAISTKFHGGVVCITVAQPDTGSGASVHLTPNEVSQLITNLQRAAHEAREAAEKRERESFKVGDIVVINYADGNLWHDQVATVKGWEGPYVQVETLTGDALIKGKTGGFCARQLRKIGTSTEVGS